MRQFNLFVWENERNLTHSYDKCPYTNGKLQNANEQHENVAFTTIGDRLWTASCSNDINQIGMSIMYILYEFKIIFKCKMSHLHPPSTLFREDFPT